MTRRIKTYPFSCPVCDTTNGMAMVDSDYDDETYMEDWQCDNCGGEWAVIFNIDRVIVKQDDGSIG